MKNEVFELLDQLGAVRAEASFSGGNDEGGVDQITLTMRDGTKSVLPGYVYESMAGMHPNDPREPQRFNPMQKRLIELMNEPVNARYGSFAGEFYVNGVVVADPASNTFALKQSYGEMAYTDSVEALP